MRSRAWHALNNGEQMRSQLCIWWWPLLVPTLTHSLFIYLLINFPSTGGPGPNESLFCISDMQTDTEILLKSPLVVTDRPDIQGCSRLNKQPLLVSISNYSNENNTAGDANLPLSSALPPSGKPASSITSDRTGSFDWFVYLSLRYSKFTCTHTCCKVTTLYDFFFFHNSLFWRARRHRSHNNTNCTWSINCSPLSIVWTFDLLTQLVTLCWHLK